ncbi:MAG TPA: acetyl-CoA carboxylase carboxyltransferase subunit alpha [Candidatus Koribacter sp.]
MAAPKNQAIERDSQLVKTGILPAVDYWISAVQTLVESPGAKSPKMEATSKAQQELERIEKQISELESAAGENQEARRQLHELHERVATLRRQITSQMGPWQKVELARHPQRPYMMDYVERLFTDFSEIHGDRGFADDNAIVCGMARFRGQECLVIGTQKGRDNKEKFRRNFGSPNPEGYRKALRAMKIAEKFQRPIVSLVDVVGAYPGLGAEERGQAEAIAKNLREMARLEVPVIAIITGEGGSGGALAIAVADRVLMMENSIYSVISPEGCASIMWRDASKKDVAAAALKITAEDNVAMGIADDIVREPAGGAHTDFDEAAAFVGEAISKHLGELLHTPKAKMLDDRYKKFREMAKFFEEV